MCGESPPAEDKGFFSCAAPPCYAHGKEIGHVEEANATPIHVCLSRRPRSCAGLPRCLQTGSFRSLRSSRRRKAIHVFSTTYGAVLRSARGATTPILRRQRLETSLARGLLRCCGTNRRCRSNPPVQQPLCSPSD